jgi:polar amino acid transport system substrate-binding protein
METGMTSFKKMGSALLVVVLCALTVVTSAHADTLTDIQQRKKIVVAIDLNSPPFGMVNDKMQPYGSDVSAAQMLAKDLGVELEIVQVTGPNRVPYLLTGKADIVIASFSITPERAKVVDFSLPYSAADSVVAGVKSTQIKSLADLVGKRVGVVRGNLQDTLLIPLVPKGTIMVRFDDDATNAIALLSGQVDAIGTAKELVVETARRNPDKHIETKFSVKVVPQGIGIRKGDSALKAWIDHWVTVNMKNGRLGESYQRAAGTALPDLSSYFPK